MSVNKLMYFLHLCFTFIFADYPGLQLYEEIYIPSNPDHLGTELFIWRFGVCVQRIHDTACTPRRMKSVIEDQRSWKQH